MTDQAELRRVLGHYPSGVVIVTALTPEGPAGMTLQSFHALSLDPPLVALFPGKASTTWPRLQAAGRFCINVLAEDQAALATDFARQGTERFTGPGWQPRDHGAPRLAGAQAHLFCCLHSVAEGGDHLVVQARIEALSADSAVAPLIFHCGTFRRLAEGP